MYSSDDPGLKVGVGGDKFKLALDYGVVAKAAAVSDLVAYATELSTPATGIIDTLSAGVDSALSSAALTVKFLGHITVYADETRRSFTQILEDEQLFDEQRRVKNGSMYQVAYLNSSGEPVGSESRYQTADGLVLGDGDYVYVHKHGLDTYVQADEIAVAGDDKTVYLADPVHRYDIAELRQFIIDNFAKLSGNNEISGGNMFHGVNSFDGDLSVGFDRLFDMRDGKSLGTLFGEISAEISARAMLSVDGDAVQEVRFQHISQDAYHNLLCGDGYDPHTLYVVSSENMCMYDRKITDLAEGELPDDACTYGQLSALKLGIRSAIDAALPAGDLSGNLSVHLDAVLQCLMSIRDALS